MNDLDKALREDPVWYKNFRSTPVTGKCDAGCGKQASEWFGNSSCATCGSAKCLQAMEEEYNNILRDFEEEHGY